MTPFIVGEAASDFSPEARARLDRIDRDVASLTAHRSRLSERNQFLLDASLGLIGVAQNEVFKILTMVSVVGIPPTLIASMYGMNFENIPEYDWSWGYPYVLTVIFLSGLRHCCGSNGAGGGEMRTPDQAPQLEMVKKVRELSALSP